MKLLLLSLFLLGVISNCEDTQKSRFFKKVNIVHRNGNHFEGRRTNTILLDSLPGLKYDSNYDDIPVYSSKSIKPYSERFIERTSDKSKYFAAKIEEKKEKSERDEQLKDLEIQKTKELAKENIIPEIKSSSIQSNSPTFINKDDSKVINEILDSSNKNMNSQANKNLSNLEKKEEKELLLKEKETFMIERETEEKLDKVFNFLNKIESTTVLTEKHYQTLVKIRKIVQNIQSEKIYRTSSKIQQRIGKIIEKLSLLEKKSDKKEDKEELEKLTIPEEDQNKDSKTSTDDDQAKKKTEVSQGKSESKSQSSGKISVAEKKDLGNKSGKNTDKDNGNGNNTESASSNSFNQNGNNAGKSNSTASSVYSIYNPETEIEHLENLGKRKRIAVAASFKKKALSKKSEIVESSILPEQKVEIPKEKLYTKELSLTHFTIYGLLADILENVKTSKNHISKPFFDIIDLLSDTSDSEKFKGGLEFIKDEADRKLPGLCGKKLINFLSYSLIQLKHWIENEIKTKTEMHWYKITIKDIQDVAIDINAIPEKTKDWLEAQCSSSKKKILKKK